MPAFNFKNQKLLMQHTIQTVIDAEKKAKDIVAKALHEIESTVKKEEQSLPEKIAELEKNIEAENSDTEGLKQEMKTIFQDTSKSFNQQSAEIDAIKPEDYAKIVVDYFNNSIN